MFLIQHCRAAALRLGNPSLALTLGLISISRKHRLALCQLPSPAFGTVDFRFVLSPLVLKRASANCTAAKVRYSDESRLHHDACFTMLTAFLCGLSRMWLNQLCMMYCVRLIVHLSVQCSERSPIFNALCGATWRVKEMQIHVDRCYKKGRWGLGSA